MSIPTNTQTIAAPIQCVAPLIALTVGLLAWSVLTPVVSADEHGDTPVYDDLGIEADEAMPEEYDVADDNQPADIPDGLPATPAEDVLDAPVAGDGDMPVNPESAADVVTPDTSEVESVPAQAQAAAEPNPMAGTLTTVVETAQGLQDNVEAGEMDVPEAVALLTELQAVVDMIEAVLGNS